MSTNNHNTLALFQYTQPDLMAGINVVARKNGVDVDAANVSALRGTDKVSLKLQLESRKLVAGRLGLGKPNQDNAPQIDAEIARMGAVAKRAMLAEVIKYATDENWQFASMGFAQAKSGKQRASFAFETAKVKATHVVSEAEMIKAMASMTDEQRLQLLSKAESLEKSLEPAIEQEAPAIDNQVAEAPAAE